MRNGDLSEHDLYLSSRFTVRHPRACVSRTSSFGTDERGAMDGV
jgi:hypothetical protein